MKRRVLSTIFVGLVSGAGVLFSAPGAVAAPSPTCLSYAAAGASEPTISDATPQPGQTITVTSGDCQFDAGGSVPTTFRGDTVGTPVASDAGGATITYTFPCTAALGPGEFVFTGPLEGVTNDVAVGLEVVTGDEFCFSGGGGGGAVAPSPAPAPSGGGIALPFTGTDLVIPGVIGGTVALLLGIVLAVGARRRRTTEV